jgi:hypothetical protein
VSGACLIPHKSNYIGTHRSNGCLALSNWTRVRGSCPICCAREVRFPTAIDRRGGGKATRPVTKDQDRPLCQSRTAVAARPAWRPVGGAIGRLHAVQFHEQTIPLPFVAQRYQFRFLKRPSGNRSLSNSLRVGAGFGFNLMLVAPRLLQSSVVYLIHCLSPMSWRKARRISNPKNPVFVFTKPGEIPRFRPWP